MSAPKFKASDKQTVCKKLVLLLKKRYKEKPSSTDRSVLETLLYAVCLENSSHKQADTAFTRLHEDFYDLNEVRVSSITELEAVFRDMERAEWRALAVRSVLHYIFEKNYAFEFEAVRRKTVDLASKQLGKIRHISPFVRDFVMQAVLGGHTVPLDEAMGDAALWLGLIEPDTSLEDAAEHLKPALRKADAPIFCHYLRCVATDPRLRGTFQKARAQMPEEGYDLFTATQRLTELCTEADRARRKRKTTKKKTASKSTTKSAARRKAAKKKTTTRKKPAAHR